MIQEMFIMLGLKKRCYSRYKGLGKVKADTALGISGRRPGSMAIFEIDRYIGTSHVLLSQLKFPH